MSVLKDFRKNNTLVTSLIAGVGLALADTDAAMAQTGIQWTGSGVTEMTPIHDEWINADVTSSPEHGIRWVGPCAELPLPSPNVNYTPSYHNLKYIQKALHAPNPFMKDWYVSEVTTGGYQEINPNGTAKLGKDGKPQCRDAVTNYHFRRAYPQGEMPDRNIYDAEMVATFNGYPGKLAPTDTLLGVAVKAQIDRPDGIIQALSAYRVGEKSTDPKHPGESMMHTALHTYTQGPNYRLVSASERDLVDTLGSTEVAPRGEIEKRMGKIIGFAGTKAGPFNDGTHGNLQDGVNTLVNGEHYRAYARFYEFSQGMDIPPPAGQPAKAAPPPKARPKP